MEGDGPAPFTALGQRPRQPALDQPGAFGATPNLDLLPVLHALEILHPRAQLDFPGPGAAVLAVDIEIGLRYCRRLEHSVGTARVAALVLDAPVDDEMGDMDVLRRELARHALREAAQSKLAHREGSGIDITLDARRGAGEQDRAAAAAQHLPSRRLPDEKAAITADHERFLDFDWVKLDERAARAVARVENDNVGGGEVARDGAEERVDIAALAGIAAIGARADFRTQRCELVDPACR